MNLVEGQVAPNTSYEDWPQYVAVNIREGEFMAMRKSWGVGKEIAYVQDTNYLGSITIWPNEAISVKAAKILADKYTPMKDSE